MSVLGKGYYPQYVSMSVGAGHSQLLVPENSAFIITAVHYTVGCTGVFKFESSGSSGYTSLTGDIDLSTVDVFEASSDAGLFQTAAAGEELFISASAAVEGHLTYRVGDR